MLKGGGWKHISNTLCRDLSRCQKNKENILSICRECRNKKKTLYHNYKKITTTALHNWAKYQNNVEIPKRNNNLLLHKFNSLWTYAAMHCYRSVGWTLHQVMACHLIRAKPIPKPMLTDCQLTPAKQTSFKFKYQYKHFLSIQCIKNVVYKMTAILSQLQWVN